MKLNIKYIITILSLFISFCIQAQRPEFAVQANLINTFFHKTNKSDFSNYFIKSHSKRNVGFSILMNSRLSPKLLVVSGIGFQTKKYKLNFSQTNIESNYSFQPRIDAFEIPVLLDYRVFKINEGSSIHFRSGTIISINKHTRNTLKDNGNSSPFSTINIIISDNWSTIVSPDVYGEVSLIKQNKNSKFELGLSYQYGLINMHKFNYLITYTGNGSEQQYKGIIHPRLSYIALRYSFYPKWLNYSNENPN